MAELVGRERAEPVGRAVTTLAQVRELVGSSDTDAGASAGGVRSTVACTVTVMLPAGLCSTWTMPPWSPSRRRTGMGRPSTVTSNLSSSTAPAADAGDTCSTIVAAAYTSRARWHSTFQSDVPLS